MQRNEVYRAIDSERAYQQAQGKPDEQPISEWTGWIMHYRTKAFDAYWAGDHQAALHEIRKIAALAVAALEQYGCQPREGYEPPSVQLLDMPDGPGLWLREGDCVIHQFAKWETDERGWIIWRTADPTDLYDHSTPPQGWLEMSRGRKWYRLTMPWEQPATAQESSEVESQED